MKYLIKKSFCFLLVFCFMLTIVNTPAFADEIQNDTKADEAFLEMMSEPGIILGSQTKDVEIELSNEFITENKDELSDEAIKNSVAIVQIQWEIGYNAADGLCFYTTAFSEDLGCLIKRIVGLNEYRDRNSAAAGSIEIRTTNIVPTYRIHDFQATERFFRAGTILDCNMFCDVEAISEISGGYADLEDTVTIPEL